MSFDLSEYVDVSERIRMLVAKHPQASLSSELTYLENPAGWLCKAYAYREPTDPCPGVGHAFEPVPGKTPYTKDSEAMNAETSAWGRAIVALGFETKKIASANEVRNRQSNGEADDLDLEALMKKAVLPSDLPVHFGKNRGVVLGSLTPAQVRWYATEWQLQDTPSDYDHLLKSAAVALHAGDDSPIPADPLADLPFA